MQTRDGRWRVDVGGVGATPWYTLVGPDRRRSFPTLDSLVAELAEVGVPLAELVEVPPADAVR